MSFYPDLDPTTSLEGASNDRLESVRKGAALRPDVDAAAFFLDALFPTEHWPGHVLIWTLNRETQKKLSHWCLSLEKAKEVITEHSSAWSRHDVYVGMGVSSPHASIGRGEGDLSPYRRLLAQPDVDIDTGDVRPTPFVHFIPGLWADVYVGEEGHHGSTGKRYAPDLETVLERLPELPIQPTIVVNSGHGTQLFWVFDELLDISPDRLAAALRQSDWIDLLRGVFHPYTLDSVSDLSRLMRLAGFINNKLPSRRVLTEVISSNGPTTTPDAVDTLLSSRRKTGGDRSSGHANKMGGPNGSPSFDPNAEVDEAKFQAAYHHNQRFAGAWDGQRLDLKDKSDSGYDMALAHEAVKLGWTPQEIIDLLIARRRMAKAKAKSKGHYELTVRKALNAQQTRLHHEGQEHSKAQRGRGPTATKEGDIAAAEEYITEVATSEDVVYWLDEFHQNQMGVWREQSKRFFENKLRGRIGRARGSGDHVVISRETVASCMGSLTSAITPPCIDTSMLRANDRLKNFDLDSGELLQGSAFANGILHVGADGGMNLVERKSRHFYQTARPYNFPTEKPSRPEKIRLLASGLRARRRHSHCLLGTPGGDCRPRVARAAAIGRTYWTRA